MNLHTLRQYSRQPYDRGSLYGSNASSLPNFVICSVQPASAQPQVSACLPAGDTENIVTNSGSNHAAARLKLPYRWKFCAISFSISILNDNLRYAAPESSRCKFIAVRRTIQGLCNHPIFIWFLPFAPITKISACPERSVIQAIFSLSGDHAGCESFAR